MAADDSGKKPQPVFLAFLAGLLRPLQRDTEKTPATQSSEELKEHYPANAREIMVFMDSLLSRRHAIVERLSKHPELNDHGFFLVICLLYMETYRGNGFTSTKLLTLIQLTSSSEISSATAARKLKMANEVGVFVVSDKDGSDARKRHYYLDPVFIGLCNEMFGGMISDVRDGLDPDGKFLLGM